MLPLLKQTLNELTYRCIFSNNIEFFKKFKIFENFSNGQINTFSYNFKEKLCHNNWVVFNENDKSEDIYFIKEGDFLVKMIPNILYKL